MAHREEQKLRSIAVLRVKIAMGHCWICKKK